MMLRRTALVALTLIVSAGCQRAAVTKVTMRGGVVVVGELTATRPDAVVVRTADGRDVVISRADVVSIDAATPADATKPAATAATPTATPVEAHGGIAAGVRAHASLPAGTRLSLSMVAALASDAAKPGEAVEAQLTAPLAAADGRIVAATGTTVRGTVVEAGRVDGRSRLAVRFDTLSLGTGALTFDAPAATWHGAIVAKRTSGGSGFGGKLKGLVSKTKKGLGLGETVSLEVRLPAGSAVVVTLASALDAPM